MRPTHYPCGNTVPHEPHDHNGPDTYYYRCPGIQTDDGAGAPTADPSPAGEATSPPAPSSPTRGYIVRYRDPDSDHPSVSWDNRVYAEYRDAAMAAIDARDRHRAPGRSWTVCRVEWMETFR